MNDTVYQVCYRAQAQYAASESDIIELNATVDAFIKQECDKKSGVIGITVGKLTGMFVAYTNNSLSALGLPLCFGKFERFWDAVELPLDKVNQSGPMFHLV